MLLTLPWPVLVIIVINPLLHGGGTEAIPLKLTLAYSSLLALLAIVALHARVSWAWPHPGRSRRVGHHSNVGFCSTADI